MIFKFLKGMVKSIAISIFNTLFTIFIVYWNIMTIANAMKTPDADWNQVWIYLACSVIILLLIWFMSFFKFLRNLVILILFLLACGWFLLPHFLPNVTDGMCVTMGSCKEGIEVKTVSGKVIMNKQSCVNNGWLWNDDKKVCNTRKQN